MLLQLLDWRRTLLGTFGPRTEMLGRRLVTEALFLEAALALVQTDVSILTGMSEASGAGDAVASMWVLQINTRGPSVVHGRGGWAMGASVVKSG